MLAASSMEPTDPYYYTIDPYSRVMAEVWILSETRAQTVPCASQGSIVLIVFSTIWIAKKRHMLTQACLQGRGRDAFDANRHFCACSTKICACIRLMPAHYCAAQIRGHVQTNSEIGGDLA